MTFPTVSGTDRSTCPRWQYFLRRNPGVGEDACPAARCFWTPSMDDETPPPGMPSLEEMQEPEAETEFWMCHAEALDASIHGVAIVPLYPIPPGENCGHAD